MLASRMLRSAAVSLDLGQGGRARPAAEWRLRVETSMRRLSDTRLATGAGLLAASALSLEMVWLHMRASATVCGLGETAHCGWCVTAAAFALAGATVLVRPLLSVPETSSSRRAAARPTAPHGC